MPVHGHPTSNVAFSRGAGWRGLCPAQTVTDRTVGYNAWLAEPFKPFHTLARFPLPFAVAGDRSTTGDGCRNAAASFRKAGTCQFSRATSPIGRQSNPHIGDAADAAGRYAVPQCSSRPRNTTFALARIISEARWFAQVRCAEVSISFFRLT